MNKYLDRLVELVASKIAERVEPKLFTISKIVVEPGDVIVLRSKRVISAEAAARLLHTFKSTLPQLAKVILLEEGLELGVLRAESLVGG